MNNEQSSKNMTQGKAPLLERFLFGNRRLLLVVFAIFTVIMGFQASKMTMGASFEKMTPNYHPYIQNYFKHKVDLKGLGNVVMIAVEAKDGDIFTEEYFSTLQQVNDEVFYFPGVDRAGLKSLWTPATRWTEVTEEGFDGGAVIPDTYDGSAESLQLLRANILKSGEVGKLVANNFKSSIIVVPLLSKDSETGLPVDYRQFSEQLEENVRTKYGSQGVNIHIVGFAKIVGDLIEGALGVLLFFALTVVMTMGLLYWYTRCYMATLMPLGCALAAVIWQAGVLHTFGYGLDPYSMLVPFLVFAIGVSHGVQMINGIKHQSGIGQSKLDAARFSFRLLYIPALCALVTDGIGFATLYVIRIGVLQDMAIGSIVRFPVLILTMLICLPLLMSYTGVSKRSIALMKDEEEGHSHPFWRTLTVFTTRRGASVLLIIVLIFAVSGYVYRQDLKIGDLDPGAPELRPDSRYNLDNGFMVENYTATNDLFVIMVETETEANSNYDMLSNMLILQTELEGLEGVQSTESMVDDIQLLSAAYNEGNFKWSALPRSQSALDNLSTKVSTAKANQSGSLSLVRVFLDDHKATTLNRVVALVEKFAAENNTEEFRFIMGAGPAGIEAATNIEIESAQVKMMLLVYGVVGFLVFLTFRSLRAMIAIMVPLALTSLLCEVLMTYLGIGVKVATLPVISIGVGIGVDYGVYIYSKMLTYRKQGMTLQDAYYNSLKTTGKAVAFTGITLSLGVCTWAFSPIKFQADMGILLAFMFIWNMVGALCVMPALVCLLGEPRAVKKALVVQLNEG